MKEIPIDLKQLRYFVHIAEFGSFTKAANFLDVAQPVLSRQIRKLEVDLGQNLLIRDGRGVSLTDSGAVLLEHSRGILHQLERAFEDVTRGQLSGHISMGLPPTLARIFSVPMTKDFHELLPDANLVITEKLSASIEEEIITGKLDMGVLHNPTRSPELDIFMLAKENLFLMAPKELKFKTTKKGVSLEEVSKLPLILPSYPNSYRLLVEMQMAKISAKPR
ncbi:MAG: LysR family transcriptional regulator, partial [Xanthomonadaceae bacterium]|nr:LysR family transcriptional regulator [Xanthomonadaceae bacterium]